MIHLPIITPKRFDTFDFLRCAMSTRQGGVSTDPLGMNLSFSVGDSPERVRENRRLFLESVGCSDQHVAQPRQCHSARVVAVKEPGWVDAADGLITDQPGLCLAISVADCLPVFLVDPAHRVVGAVHAGWRGTAGGIVQNAVRLMQDTFGTVGSDLTAFLGPSARPCCYEVGSEVAARFDKQFVDRRNGRLYLDIAGANRAQLVEMGVRQDSIEISELCTITEKDLLHSYRRDGSRSGRMLGVITIVF